MDQVATPAAGEAGCTGTDQIFVTRAPCHTKRCTLFSACVPLAAVGVMTAAADTVSILLRQSLAG